MKKFAIAAVAVIAALVPSVALAGNPIPVQILPGVPSGHLKITGSAHFNHSLVFGSNGGDRQACEVSQVPGHGAVTVEFDRVHILTVAAGKLHEGTTRMSKGVKVTLEAGHTGYESHPLRSTGSMTLTNNLMNGHFNGRLWPAAPHGGPVNVVANWHCISHIGLPLIPGVPVLS